MIPSSFPKIMQLGLKPIKDIFVDEVEITEKLDGSQFGFGLVDGQLKMRSKGTEIFVGQVQDLFIPVVDYITSIKDRLPDNVFFYGETLKRPKHNTLCYSSVPKNHFSMFGAYDIKDDDWYLYSGLENYANELDVDVVPLIFKGYIERDNTNIDNFLDRESYLGGAKIEGFVVKNYSKQTRIAQDIYTPFMAGKYVSEAFKEVHRDRWKDEETKNGKWAAFCKMYQTQARWDKAIIHLKEKGELLDDPKDIGRLLKEINFDIELEEKEIVKEYLWSVHKKELISAATRGFPEYYKQRLLND